MPNNLKVIESKKTKGSKQDRPKLDKVTYPEEGDLSFNSNYIV
jgi:hypothetical protein